MKKRWNRLLAGLLVLLILFSSAPLAEFAGLRLQANASTESLVKKMDGFFYKKKKEFETNYPLGKWDINYSYKNGKAWTCHGFANDLWLNTYGYDTYMGVHRRLSSQANVSASAIKSYILSTARPGDMLRIEKKGDIQPHTVVIRSISDSGVEFYTYGSPFEYYNGPQIVTKPWTWFASKLISPDKTYTTSYFLYQMKDKIYNESGGSSIPSVIPKPEPPKPVFQTGIYMVNVDGLAFRSGPSTSYSAYTSFNTGKIVNVTSIENTYWGKTTVDGKTGYIYLDSNYCNYKGSIPEPSGASVSANRSGTTFVGDSVTVSWYAKNTDRYDVRLMCDGIVLQELTNQTRTSTVFSLNRAGTYSVSVMARNAVGIASATKNSFVTVKNPSVVTFKDWDGTVLGTQRVAYGKNAPVLQIPSREGYTFTGWDRSLNNITADTVIQATYKINTYTIKFLNASGTVLKTERVQYLHDATPPEDPQPEAGYAFFGWNSESYKAVKGDATIRGVYYWKNEDIPITCTNVTANRQQNGYYITFSLTNNTDDTSRTINGRAVVTLKTADGKLVDTTESSAFSIAPKAAENGIRVFVPCQKTATIAEVIVVDGYLTGIPLSEMHSETVNQGTEWSDWSDTKPDGNVYTNVESRTVYRYSDKQTTTSSSSSLSGWTKYNTTSEWSDYGAWSGWQDTAVSSSDSRQVETRQVVASYNYKNIYHFWKYSKSQYGATYSNVPTTTYGKNYYTYETDNPAMFKDPQDVSYNGRNDTLYSFCYDGSHWFSVYKASPFVTQEIVSPNYKTQYQFRDRHMIYTYYYYKWSDWSRWSANAVSATSNRQVETKTQWRYKNTFAGSEDVSGVERNFSGQLDTSYAGKQATLFVYKIYEASDWTNGFIGQTKIAADGSYSFTFKLREEPSERTGDFTVALGVEGTNNMTVIGTIEAPKPTYTVSFYDGDGNLIGTPQQITQGESAVVPETVPEKDGYTFVGWSDTTTNVRSDLDVQAQFVRNTYTVTFVNWITQDVEQREFAHGESVMPPEQKDVEGYDFIGWSNIVLGETVATESMVCEAQYEKKTFDVTVYDYNGDILDQLTVAYDNCVELDMNYEKPNSIFLGWEDLNGQPINAVHGDMDVYPQFVFEETTEPPYASIEGSSFSEAQNVELFCDTQDAVIFYTIDGSDPLQSMTAVEYTKPISISHSLELRFAASAFAKNDSTVVTEQYAINTGDYESNWMLFDEIPLYVRERADDYTFYKDIGYKYKNVETTSSLSAIKQYQEDGWEQEGVTLGEQSEWQREQPDLPDTAFELIVDEHPQIEATRFRYTHFKYYDEEAGEYAYNNTEVEGVSGEWEEYLSETRLPAHIVGTLTYYEHDGVQWFNQKTVTIMVDADYELYSYKIKTYTFSKWTDWTPDAPQAGDTRENITDEVFQYIVPEMAVVTVRGANEEIKPQKILSVIGKPLVYATTDKTLGEAKIDFEKKLMQEGYKIAALYTKSDELVPTTVWGDWSDWQDEAVSASDTRIVEEREVIGSFDYITQYHFFRYSTAPDGTSYSNVPTSAYGTERFTYTTDDLSKFKFLQNVSYNGRTDAMYSYNYGSKWIRVYADSPFVTQEVVSSNQKTQYRYKDSHIEMTDEIVWDITKDLINGAITLYIRYETQTFTASFRDADGNLLDTQTVSYGQDAVPPTVETPAGSSFVRWDSDAWQKMTADADVTAIVKPDNEIVRVTISRSKFTTMVGSAFALRATVENADEEHSGVTWSSSNELVANVSENGAVNAVGAGTATVTATAYDGTSASCVVSVVRNTDNELYLKEETTLRLDLYGNLRNIPLLTDYMHSEHKAETAGYVKAQFVNENITMVDNNGSILDDDAPVGTGSAVLIRDGNTVVDKREIVVTGDFDGDGQVTNRDAAKIVAVVVGKETASYIQMLAIDVNGDGSINGRDASMLSRYLVGKEKI